MLPPSQTSVNQSQLEEHLDRSSHLTYFRMAFAGIVLVSAFFAQRFGAGDIDPVGLVASSVTVLIFNVLAYFLLNSKRTPTRLMVDVLNGSLILVDITALSCVVHFTKGIESDLFFLYLLPILLASNVFSKRGIYLTAIVASLAYVVTVVSENAGFLKYLAGDSSGLTGAYSQRLFGQILSRSLILFLVSLIWAAFCHRVSKLAHESNKRLAEQLKANTLLLDELKSNARREQLINAISIALRRTLDLDIILATTSRELSDALNNAHCILVSKSASPEGVPMLWDSQVIDQEVSQSKITDRLKNYFMEHPWRKETSQTQLPESPVQKLIISDAPFNHSDFEPIKAELISLGVSTVLVRSLMYGSSLKGVLVIFSEGKMRIWSAPEIELIDSVSGQVAIAIEHAELLSKLSSSNQDLTLKNENLDIKNLELREMQSQLIHQEKMASLGRIVAGIAHELNNPINFVHGNLPYLREYFSDMRELIACFEEVPAENKQAAQAMMQKINYQFVITDLDNIIADLSEGTERIRQIIRNLRSFSRLDEAELKEASISEGIESTLKILSQYYGRDKIPVETDFCQMPPVLCYPGKLNQVWMNLLGNAAEALSNVKSPLVRIRTRLEADSVLVSIEDNGPGINSSDQSKIFEPFYTTKPVGQGTGLGLSISHSIVERHGGLIWFESAPGKGTTFTVKIPLKAQNSSGDEVEELAIEAKLTTER